MFQGLHASLSSYEFSRKSLAASSSSSGHSPMSLPSTSPQLSLKRPQINPHGSHSYDARTKEKYKTQLIEETIAQGASDTSNEPQRLTLRRTRSSEPPIREGLAGAAAAISFPAKKSNESSPAVSSKGGHVQNRSSTPGSKLSRPSRPSRTRTRSSGIWYHTRKNTSSQDDSSVRSVTSTVPKSDNSELPIIRIEPLKPFPRPGRPQPATTHHITVETPFSEVDKQLGVAIQDDSGASLKNERRRSSIDARRLFSAPLQVFRKVVQVKTSKSPSIPSTPTQFEAHISPAHGKGHKSLLKKEQTGITLERVASLLEGHKPPKLLSRSGTRTNLKSVSTTSLSEINDSRLEMAKTISSTFNIFNKDSHGASTTSSILNMQMGSTPQNTPTELATYKVKRSPSAETEEFLKIDISVRGGTSYLPSEARRIHTPPLPGDKDTGMRRGYFFDYNAPKSDGSHCHNFIQPHQSLPSSRPTTSGIVATKPQMEQEFKMTLASTLAPAAMATKVPTSKLLRTPSHRIATTTSLHPADFYDAKLADVDATPTDIDITTKKHEKDKRHQCKNECQANLAEIKRQQYEAQLDYNIPEHFPSSLLCPRNPEYWRVVKKKGSQFRGCWMHGFGEYTAVPGRAQVSEYK